MQLKYTAAGKSPEVLAVYEAWFGFHKHISVGYSSHDTDVLDNQIEKAKGMGISGFVIDWYGDREPFIDQSYALMQQAAAKHNFNVAMMYDETNQEDGATDEAIADFNVFYKTYLAPNAPGHEAYLTYQGHPVIFIFPKGGHTHWDKVRAAVNKWPVPPLLITKTFPASMRMPSTATMRGSIPALKDGSRMAATGVRNTWITSTTPWSRSIPTRSSLAAHGPALTTARHHGA